MSDDQFFCYIGPSFLLEIAPENPVLWTGMKGVSAKGRENLIRC